MRQFLESARIALSALWANKLRSVLTLVGVVVGVATIIAIVSMITGMNQFVATQISSLGANTFILDRHGIITSEEQWWERRSWKKITVADMKVIQENCESCELVGGRTFVRRQIKNGNRYVDGAIVMGSTANFPLIVDFDIENGYYPTESDYNHRRQVAFIGHDIIDNLFPGVETDIRLAVGDRMANFREGSESPVNRNNRIAGLHHDGVPGMPESRWNRGIDPLVGRFVIVAGQHPDRAPSGLLGTAGNSLHHPVQTAAHNDCAVLSEQAAYLFRRF